MAENTMKLEVITPERSFYTGDVTFVELNTTEGEVGIYARHIPMTMIIAPGVLTITEEDGTKKKAALLKGFVEVTETTMSILAEVAEWPEDIDVERAKKAEKRARKRLPICPPNRIFIAGCPWEMWESTMRTFLRISLWRSIIRCWNGWN